MELKTMKVTYLDKGVCLLTIDNPPANTLSGDLQDDIYQLVDNAENNPDIRVVVLTSAHPKIFVAGADLNNVGGNGEDTSIDEGIRLMQEAFNQLEQLSKPTITAINGHALGGGCELAMACDFRLMSTDATIGLTEVSLGLIPGAGGTQRMTRLIGEAKATELIFLGKRLKAEEAEEIGLVHRAVSNDSLLDETLAFADKLAGGAVQAMGLAKKSIHAAVDESLEEGLKVERSSFAKTFTTGEVEEGTKAFFEKRKPDFLGVTATTSE